MRDNSGQGESRNNNRDPHLKELERARGVSGEAIQGEKKSAGNRESTGKTGTTGAT